MLVRDVDGNVIIINRKDCKNEAVYNNRLYNIRLGYTTIYKSVTINPAKKGNYKQSYFSKNVADD